MVMGFCSKYFHRNYFNCNTDNILHFHVNFQKHSVAFIRLLPQYYNIVCVTIKIFAMKLHQTNESVQEIKEIFSSLFRPLLLNICPLPTNIRAQWILFTMTARALDVK